MTHTPQPQPLFACPGFAARYAALLEADAMPELGPAPHDAWLRIEEAPAPSSPVGEVEA